MLLIFCRFYSNLFFLLFADYFHIPIFKTVSIGAIDFVIQVILRSLYKLSYGPYALQTSLLHRFSPAKEKETYNGHGENEGHGQSRRIAGIKEL